MSAGRWSLRRRLLVAIGGAALLGWCASSFWLYSEAIAETDRGFDVALDHAARAVLAFVANENRELRDAESAKESTWRRSITCMASRSSTRCADPEAASPTDRPAPPPNLSRVGTIVDSHSSARTAADSGSIRSPRRTVLRRSMSRNRSKSATLSRTPSR